MLPQHEKLRHVAVDRPIRMRHAIEQREADDLRACPQQQRHVVLVAPVRIERVRRKAALVIDLADRAVVPVLREVMRVELHEVLENDSLFGAGDYDFDWRTWALLCRLSAASSKPRYHSSVCPDRRVASARLTAYPLYWTVRPV